MNRYQSGSDRNVNGKNQNEQKEQLSNGLQQANQEDLNEEEEVNDEEDYSSDGEEVSTDEWGNSLNGSIHTDEYSEEEFKPTGENERANHRTETNRTEEFNWGNATGDRTSMFPEYSRDRRSSRPTERKADDASGRRANGASQTVRVFTWSDDEEASEEQQTDSKVESKVDGDRKNVDKTIESIRYLKENDAVIERLIERADSSNFVDSIQQLTDSLPRLSCTYGRTKLNGGQKIHYSQLLFDNEACLNTVFGESPELCDRKMVFMLKLQFAKMRS